LAQENTHIDGGTGAHREDLMKNWHRVLLRRYSAIETFNHRYPLLRAAKIDGYIFGVKIVALNLLEIRRSR